MPAPRASVGLMVFVEWEGVASTWMDWEKARGAEKSANDSARRRAEMFMAGSFACGNSMDLKRLNT